MEFKAKKIIVNFVWGGGDYYYKADITTFPAVWAIVGITDIKHWSPCIEDHGMFGWLPLQHNATLHNVKNNIANDKRHVRKYHHTSTSQQQEQTMPKNKNTTMHSTERINYILTHYNAQQHISLRRMLVKMSNVSPHWMHHMTTS